MRPIRLPSGLVTPPAPSRQPGESPISRPLVLDLDGTVVRGNLLVETALAFLKQHPLKIFMIFVWLFRGRAELKQQLAQRAQVDVEVLPLNDELLAYAAEQVGIGRQVYIATAADAAIANQVAARIPFVSEVIASDGKTNLKGAAKAAVLAERFPNGFEYAGDASADLPVWRAAGYAAVVEASPSVVAAARSLAEVTRVFPRPAPWKALIKSLRLHQWAKNALVFVPLILGGRLGDPTAVLATCAAFLAMSFVASATYIVNDIVDLADDRRHWSKRERPLASGRLPLMTGASAVPIGLVAGFSLAAFAGWAVVLATILYLACTLTYSFKLKKLPILDGFTLASLFTLRLGAGILASGAPASPWLLVFSMFLFASLSFAKRHTEVARVIERGGTEVRGRGYKAIDLPLILAIGIATGMCAVLILVLYIINDAFRQSFYGNTMWLWGFPAVLFLFICRIWLMCQRGQMNDDPVVFAVRDRPSLALGGSLMLCFIAAWAGMPAL
ncbi:prenyltransferase [Afipia sp. P52-10]|uniref:UbiA family prenyltransferase n=1 Tax=Afipia sp. P52-10 TaxID=1429916 RepID=UPI0003DF4704|nr:UbiA family prenyltransferase [Afipia sp. P52-10]ETR78353.1 prenyltransferase [Afipia sp. P52-10]